MSITKEVRPLLSMTKEQCRHRVLSLYKSCQREIPEILLLYDIPKYPEDLRRKIRELFMINKDLTDIRVIDMLVIKGQMALAEFVGGRAQRSHAMKYFDNDDMNEPRKCTDFLSKFFAGTI